MDRVEKYRQAIREVLRYHAEMPSDQPDIESTTLCDESTDNYMLLDIDTKGISANTGLSFFCVCVMIKSMSRKTVLSMALPRT